MDDGMRMEKDPGAAPNLRIGRAYAERIEVRFIHAEASDAGRMSFPVLHVLSRVNVIEGARAKTHSFARGVKGMGLLGLHPSVADSPPGTEGYGPPRSLPTVT
jgi:hypothetical protein